MTARRGQVALYLALSLLALAVLAFVSFNTFLAVRSKNRMMNAVDEAAITVARYQGYLLNQLGQKNVEHLRDAVRGVNRVMWTLDESVPIVPENRLLQMREQALFGPLKALEKADAVAREWYREETQLDARALACFADHISEILGNPDIYLPDDGVWPRYAQALAQAVTASTCILPGYLELAHPGATGLFSSRAFYDVLSSKAWCWFTVGNNSQYLEAGKTFSTLDGLEPVPSPENSEAFSLHVTFSTWEESPWKGVFDETWTNFVCQVTGLSREDFSPFAYATDPDQVWVFYDDNWKRWSDTFNPDNFPIRSSVRPEYDVAGCLASCVMVAGLSQMRTKSDVVTQVRTMRVTAEAKPLGTVCELGGTSRAPVTAYRHFIAAAYPEQQIFTEAQLVLMGSVPRSPGVSMTPGWYEHVRHHGESPSASCRYCQLWGQWCQDDYRASIQDWILRNNDACHPSGPGKKVERGGYEWAH